jgi:hypothetical protein
LPGGAPVRRAGGAEDLLPEGSQPPMPMNSREGGYADASFDQLTLDPGTWLTKECPSTRER